VRAAEFRRYADASNSGASSDPKETMRSFLFVSICLVAVACRAPEPTVEAPPHPLVGTWELVEWRAKDSVGVWQEEFGAEPRGYFVYGASGFLSIQLMHEDGAEVTGCTDDVPEELAEGGLLVAPRCYVGYFGSYRIEDDSTVVHLPTGGTILSYIGTEQPRRFEVRGDSLWIERSDSVHRLLRRIR